MKLLGIDLGGRTTGKTSLALLDFKSGKMIHFSRELISKECGKSDELLIKFIEELKPEFIGIDAPLSLPDFKSGNYLYRSYDKKLKALSPMTLGEITARAIHLKESLSCRNVCEVYPKTILELYDLNHKGYKRNIDKQNKIWNFIRDKYDLNFPEIELNEDNLDSILALLIVFHYKIGKFKNVNDEVPFIIPTL